MKKKCFFFEKDAVEKEYTNAYGQVKDCYEIEKKKVSAFKIPCLVIIIDKLPGKATFEFHCEALNLRVEANTLNEAKVRFANALKRVKKNDLEKALE